MIFRQLFEPVSCTYSYLLACPDTGACALIDPVIDTVERDLQVLRDLGLRSPIRGTLCVLDHPGEGP